MKTFMLEESKILSACCTLFLIRLMKVANVWTSCVNKLRLVWSFTTYICKPILELGVNHKVQ